MRLDKQASGRRWVDLQAQVNRWDPLGLIAAGCPVDEYDCLVGGLMRRLEKSEPPSLIAAYLDHELTDHFGASPLGPASQQFAIDVSSWFQEHWSGTSV